MANILQSRAVLATLSIERWHPRRFDSDVTNEVHEAHNAQDAGRWNKKLINTKAPSFQALMAICTAARRFHLSETTPWFDEGIRLLPSARFTNYSAKMTGFRQEYESKAVPAFIADFPKLVDEARVRLNGMFDAADYPSADQLPGSFRFRTVIQACPDMNDFRVTLADDEMAAVQATLREEYDRVNLKAKAEIMLRVLDTVGHMAERLKAYKPAAKKGEKSVGTFKDSMVEHVRDLADLLPSFNYEDDPGIAKLCTRIKNELCDFDADELRNSDTLRKNVAAEADAILAAAKDFLA